MGDIFNLPVNGSDVFAIDDSGNVEAGGSLTLGTSTLPAAGVWQRAFVSLTPAQIRALRATPITLVAAPGAGKLLVFHCAKLFLDYGTVAHSAPSNGGDDLGVRYTGTSGQLVATQEATGFINASADAVRLLRAGSAAVNSAQDVVPVANSPLVLHNVGAAEFSGTGDSPLEVVVFYSVLTADESA